jgi:DDE superfamily endonuclease
MDPSRFVFLDETGATTAMTRRYGWGVRGERLVDAAPAGHWKTTTFVAGLRSTRIIAPLVLDGPMTGEWFRAYVEQMLAPALQPGDVVVLDNLPAHKAAGVETAIRQAGASLLYRPAYSPDLVWGRSRQVMPRPSVFGTPVGESPAEGGRRSEGSSLSGGGRRRRNLVSGGPRGSGP